MILRADFNKNYILQVLRNNFSFGPCMISLIWKSNRILKVPILTGIMMVPFKNPNKKENTKNSSILDVLVMNSLILETYELAKGFISKM